MGQELSSQQNTRSRSCTHVKNGENALEKEFCKSNLAMRTRSMENVFPNYEQKSQMENLNEPKPKLNKTRVSANKSQIRTASPPLTRRTKRAISEDAPLRQAKCKNIGNLGTPQRSSSKQTSKEMSRAQDETKIRVKRKKSPIAAPLLVKSKKTSSSQNHAKQTLSENKTKSRLIPPVKKARCSSSISKRSSSVDQAPQKLKKQTAGNSVQKSSSKGTKCKTSPIASPLQAKCKKTASSQNNAKKPPSENKTKRTLTPTVKKVRCSSSISKQSSSADQAPQKLKKQTAGKTVQKNSSKETKRKKSPIAASLLEKSKKTASSQKNAKKTLSENKTRSISTPTVKKLRCSSNISKRSSSVDQAPQKLKKQTAGKAVQKNSSKVTKLETKCTKTNNSALTTKKELKENIGSEKKLRSRSIIAQLQMESKKITKKYTKVIPKTRKTMSEDKAKKNPKINKNTTTKNSKIKNGSQNIGNKRSQSSSSSIQTKRLKQVEVKKTSKEKKVASKTQNIKISSKSKIGETKARKTPALSRKTKAPLQSAQKISSECSIQTDPKSVADKSTQVDNNGISMHQPDISLSDQYSNSSNKNVMKPESSEANPNTFLCQSAFLLSRDVLQSESSETRPGTPLPSSQVFFSNNVMQPKSNETRPGTPLPSPQDYFFPNNELQPKSSETRPGTPLPAILPSPQVCVSSNNAVESESSIIISDTFLHQPPSPQDPPFSHSNDMEIDIPNDFSHKSQDVINEGVNSLSNFSHGTMRSENSELLEDMDVSSNISINENHENVPALVQENQNMPSLVQDSQNIPKTSSTVTPQEAQQSDQKIKKIAGNSRRSTSVKQGPNYIQRIKQLPSTLANKLQNLYGSFQNSDKN